MKVLLVIAFCVIVVSLLFLLPVLSILAINQLGGNVPMNPYTWLASAWFTYLLTVRLQPNKGN